MAGLNLNIGQEITSSISNVGQFATTYQVPTFNSPDILAAGGASSTTNPSNISSFFSKAGSIFSEGAHLVEGAADWVGRTIAEGAKGAVDLPGSMYNFGQDWYHTINYGHEQQNLADQTSQLSKDYISGKLTLQEWTNEMKGINTQNNTLGTKMQGLTTKIGSDGNAVIKNTVATAADVLTVMSAGLTSPLTMAADQGTKDTAEFLMGQATNAAAKASVADETFAPVENAIKQFVGNAKLFNQMPEYVQNSIKGSVTDRLMQAGAQITSKEAVRTVAANMALKYPIAFNWLNGTGDQLYSELKSGKYGDAMKTLGFNASLMLLGGPIGEALKGAGGAIKEGASAVKGAFFGSSSFLDTVSAAIGNHDPAGLYNAIKDNPELIKNFQALEASNLAATDGKVTDAAYRVINGLKANGWDLSSETGMTHGQFAEQVSNWNNAQRLLSETLTSKLGTNEAQKYVVGRWTAQDANRIAAALTQGDLGGSVQTVEDRLQSWESYKAANPNMSFANNENLNKQLTTLIKNTDDPSVLDNSIRNISAQVGVDDKLVPKAVGEQLAKMGYVPISPSKLEAPFIEGTQKLTTNAAAASDDFFQKAAQPMPVLKEVGSALTSAGLSPVRAQESVNTLFQENLAKNLENTSLIRNIAGENTDTQGQKIMQQITDWVNETNKNASKFNLKAAPITDWRQLTSKELQAALGISADDAKQLGGAINQSMLDIQLSQRGLGPKFVDYMQSFRPGTKLSMSGYLRIQGAGRFAWNPFFKLKMLSKTEILTQLESGGKLPPSSTLNKAFNSIFGDGAATLDDNAKLLDNKGYFGGGLSNEASDETGAGYSASKSSSLVLSGQKKSIAGLIQVQADKVGMTVDDYTNNFPNEVRDTVQSILHYNPKGDFINSPLARTLNFAFFPFRFNIKVSGYMARAVMSQDPLTRVGIIAGMFQAHHFLSSQEGQIWYSQNSDALGLLTYFSPLETLQTISALGHIGHDSVGAYGELGGLPLGFVTQMLTSQGFLLSSQAAYLNPKTGVPSPNYIPNTMRAKLASAISSFMGSLFTYPGSEAGLPSKTGTLTKIGEGFSGATSSQWTKVPPNNLTPAQQQYEQALQQFNQGAQASKTVPGATQGQNITAPETGNATAQPFYTKTDSSTPPTPKLKKNQFPLSVLPGQTAIGQLP